MCGLLVDGLILTAVLSLVTGEDIGSDLGGLFKAGLLAFSASVMGALAAFGLALVMPVLLAQIMGLAVAATALGFVIMLVYSLDVRRALYGVAGYVGVKLVFLLTAHFFAI